MTVDAAPSLTCPHCGQRRWTLLSVTAGRDLGVLRVRVYASPCDARLYTHEHLTHEAPPTLIPQGRRSKGRRARFDEHPCTCGCSDWTHVTTYAPHPGDPPTLHRRHAYRCPRCARLMHTEEHLKGITEGPTPREARSHRPHPHL